MERDGRSGELFEILRQNCKETASSELETALELLKVAEGLVYSLSPALIKKYDTIRHVILTKYFEDRRQDVEQRLERLREEKPPTPVAQPLQTKVHELSVQSERLETALEDMLGEHETVQPVDPVDELEDYLVEKAIVVRDELAGLHEMLDERVENVNMDVPTWASKEEEEEESPTALVMIQSRRWVHRVRLAAQQVFQLLEPVPPAEEDVVVQDRGMQTEYSLLESQMLAKKWEQEQERRIQQLTQEFAAEVEGLREHVDIIKMDAEQAMQEEKEHRMYAESVVEALAKAMKVESNDWEGLIKEMQATQKSAEEQKKTIDILRKQNRRLVESSMRQ